MPKSLLDLLVVIPSLSGDSSSSASRSSCIAVGFYCFILISEAKKSVYLADGKVFDALVLRTVTLPVLTLVLIQVVERHHVVGQSYLTSP